MLCAARSACMWLGSLHVESWWHGCCYLTGDDMKGNYKKGEGEMKKVMTALAIGLVALATFPGSALALDLGQNITIPDLVGSGSGWAGAQEDQEVEPGCLTGQQWDMEFETRNDVTVPEYMEMIRLKTSVLLSAALKIGAVLGGASSFWGTESGSCGFEAAAPQNMGAT